MEKLHDPRMHPCEGLDRCADVLAFLSASLVRPDNQNFELSQKEMNGFMWILDLVESGIREISDKVGVADPECFVVKKDGAQGEKG